MAGICKEIQKGTVVRQWRYVLHYQCHSACTEICEHGVITPTMVDKPLYLEVKLKVNTPNIIVMRVPFSSVGRPGVPCAEALSSLRHL